MKQHMIDRAEVFVVGPEVDRYTWAEGMSEQFMVNIILRLTAVSGLEGIAGAAMITSNGFDRSVGEALRPLLPDLIGQSPAHREALWHQNAQFRDAHGAAGPFADRHRPLGHGRSPGRRAALPICSAARATRSSPMPQRRCWPTTRPMSIMSRRGRRRGSRRSSFIAGACRSAISRCARPSTGISPGATWR